MLSFSQSSSQAQGSDFDRSSLSQKWHTKGGSGKYFKLAASVLRRKILARRPCNNAHMTRDVTSGQVVKLAL
jgi:hypothetical protein